MLLGDSDSLAATQARMESKSSKQSVTSTYKHQMLLKATEEHASLTSLISTHFLVYLIMRRTRFLPRKLLHFFLLILRCAKMRSGFKYSTFIFFFLLIQFNMGSKFRRGHVKGEVQNKHVAETFVKSV